MDSLQSLDVALFRFINVHLKNPVFDWVLPFFNTNVLFLPTLLVLAIYLVWKGGVRGRVFVFFMLLTFVIGDPVIVSSLKKLIGRPRPLVALKGINILVGKVGGASMPSGHAANWFAATVVAAMFYRRTLAFMLTMACIEAFSRVYLGAHYPSDVLAGSVLGMTYAALILWLSESLWGSLGRRWFPIWHTQLPSLLHPPTKEVRPLSQAKELAQAAEPETAVSLDQHWLRLAYLLIGLLFVGHLLYLAAGRIQLTEDEAYQWLWSKHLALSYFSKPPLIAYTQFIGTHIWGDTEFGIRFMSPLIAALTSLMLVRFLAREAGGFAACMAVVVATACPLLMVGATLMTIDTLSVLFWVAALITGWKAVQQDSTRAWLWTGIWMGVGFLAKYIGLFQWVCWAVLFALWPAARKQLRRPGPYLALLVNLIFLVPVLLWNAQHHWITVDHLANRGGLDKSWQPTLRFVWDFLLAEGALLNPVFLVATVVAAIGFWRRPQGKELQLYLFSMGAPLFLFYGLYTLRSRVQPNWIAPAVMPLFALMVVYWSQHWREGSRWARHGLIAGLALGWVVVVPLHETQLITKVTGYQLPWELDPLTRVLGWKETAEVVAKLRAEMLKEGKPVFIIGNHYGVTSILSFYMPEAKSALRSVPVVYCEHSETPQNQFYFWPSYESRKGQNAIYIAGVDRPQSSPPPTIYQEFAHVTDLGSHEVLYKDRVFHRLHVFACRDLR